MLASNAPLTGSRVLVVEDEYFIAKGMGSAIVSAGGKVVGPYASVEDTWRGLWAHSVDLAVLDIRLRDGDVFEIAEKLDRSGVSFIFATGYGPDMVPPCWQHLIRCEKPFDHRGLVAALARLPARRR